MKNVTYLKAGLCLCQTNMKAYDYFFHGCFLTEHVYFHLKFKWQLELLSTLQSEMKVISTEVQLSITVYIKYRMSKHQ